jgi:NAD(P)H dehydrogenase (quinone)
VLTTDGHKGATYVLTGPEALGYADIAARFAAVFAWQVEYADLTPQRERELLLANGLSPWEADGAIERFDWIRQGGADTVTGTVRDLTGADARPLHEWLSESRATFAGLP